jgi:hypothetical protein
MSGKKQFFEGPIVFILFSAGHATWDAVVRPHVFRGQVGGIEIWWEGGIVSLENGGREQVE